jgi:hypothetical protein
MIDITRQVTGIAKKLDTLADLADILTWIMGQQNLYCSVAAHMDNKLSIECGGVDLASVFPEIGQWLVFDGEKFSALTQEEFDARGYTNV